MSQWRRALDESALPSGAQRFCAIEGVELALFHLREPERIIAVHNSCPHASGNLSAGTVSGCVVACPWHAWEFDLTSGACVHNESVRLRRYATRCEDGAIWVDLDPMPHSSAPPGAAERAT